ncbi:SDR family oxidoreductase [Spirosoma sp. 209]|uniref:SDR family NAD(P)-dependent oxidoreductase n=1 Tax=Spirosoma sp. 209 TaxID=1955701 RepID=UPI00098D2265|nr:SDR family oxidoreductase [Spirosoma sp. 209]
MNEFILLTGASSGIGLSMARLLAAQKQNLILVARRLDRLETLKAELVNEHGIIVYTFAKDLSSTDEVVALHHEISALSLLVTRLVNNAGFGTYGPFDEGALEPDLRMINLNVGAVVTLTKLFLPDMKRRGSGHIMNVASLLSFLPFPYYSVYSATKAFVLSFSETLEAELAGSGVTVSAFCPGPVDTGFTTDAMLKTNAYATNKPADVQWVAAVGVRHLLSGKGVKIVGRLNWLLANTPRFSPRWLTMRINKFLASPKR